LEREAKQLSGIPMIVFLVSDKTISIVGAGSLGTAVIDALKRKGHQRAIATRRNQEKLDELQQRYCIEVSNNNNYAVENSDVVILSVKPNYLDDVCKEIKYFAKDKLVISLAAGKSIANIESILDQSRVCRVMTGIFVSDEVAAYTLGSKTTEEDEAVVKYIFGGSARKVAEDGLTDRTWIACYTGLVAKVSEYIINSLSGLSEEDARTMLSTTITEVGKHLSIMSGDKIYHSVAGPNSHTGKLHASMVEMGIYHLIDKCLK
jgi:pyrroline-5-carboxylate reductase